MKLHTVMILDDEEWIVRGLAEMLDWEEQGFTVAGQFTDPELALQNIRALEPDLLLLDIHMPKLSGGVLMDMIREEGIPTEFIILSGYSDFSVSQKAINHGAYGYLLKPLKTQELVAALRRVKRTLEEREQKEIAIPIDPMNYEAFFQHAWRGREAAAEAGKAYQLILSDDGGTGHLPAFEGAVTSRAGDEDLGQIPTTVSDIKEYLHQHYSEPVTLSHIARKFYPTPSYLCEVFKKFTGCTITGYLLRLRMEKASELLLETELSLADVASQVSYSDYNYFCRLFKRYYNVPPAAYRKEKREMLFS